MKSTAKALLTTFALALMASLSTLRAEDGEHKGPRGGGRMDPEKRIEQIDKAVTLTADQKTQIRAIYAKTEADLKDLAPEERREKGREILEGTRAQVRALLTADQQAKFDAMPKPPMGGRGKGKRPE